MLDKVDKIATLEKQLAELTMPLEMIIEKQHLLMTLYEDEKRFDLARQLIDNISKSKDASKYANYLKKAYDVLAFVDFHSYLIALEWNRPIEQRFYLPRIKVFRDVVRDLQDLADGKLEFYMLNMPPRVGKSTLGLLYLTWLGMREPMGSSLTGSYSTGLAKSFYAGVLEFINNESYRFNEIMGEHKVSTSAEYLTIDIGEDRRYKTWSFRSIDGTITGAVEANTLLYLDDLCSGIEEALNLTRLEKLWSKVTVDLLQRRVNNRKTGKVAPILAIGTIWSIHDPLSKLAQEYEGRSDAKVVRIPALDDNGESNFDYDYGVGFSTQYYEDQKKVMDEISFQCVYQQNAIERDGLVFPSDSLKRYIELPNEQPDEIFAAVDVAFGGDDFLSMPIAYRYGDDVYITDWVFMKGSYEITEPVVTGKILEHKVQRDKFESNNGGDFYARDIQKLLETEHHKCNITTERASSKQSKLSRIIQHSPAILNMYFKDESLYKQNEMYGKAMNNLTTFVQTGTNKNDDAPDSMALLATMVRSNTLAKVGSNDKIRNFL